MNALLTRSYHSLRAARKLQDQEERILKTFFRPALLAHAAPKPTLQPQPVSTLPSGFIAKQHEPKADLTFCIARTAKSKDLPVYSDIRHGGTKFVTVVRKVTGDRMLLARELTAALGGVPAYVGLNSVEVEGHRVTEVKAWLAGLGF